jgi:replication initiation and membrane attachment protein DnaB
MHRLFSKLKQILSRHKISRYETKQQKHDLLRSYFISYHDMLQKLLYC